jgi:archaellum biogenesis protein FlaJ (TadC family)
MHSFTILFSIHIICSIFVELQVFIGLNIWTIFLNCVQIMAIENLRKHLIFSTLKFEYKNFGGKEKIKREKEK